MSYTNSGAVELDALTLEVAAHYLLQVLVGSRGVLYVKLNGNGECLVHNSRSSYGRLVSTYL